MGMKEIPNSVIKLPNQSINGLIIEPAQLPCQGVSNQIATDIAVIRHSHRVEHALHTKNACVKWLS